MNRGSGGGESKQRRVNGSGKGNGRERSELLLVGPQYPFVNALLHELARSDQARHARRLRDRTHRGQTGG